MAHLNRWAKPYQNYNMKNFRDKLNEALEELPSEDKWKSGDGITASELIDILRSFPPDVPIVVCDPNNYIHAVESVSTGRIKTNDSPLGVIFQSDWTFADDGNWEVLD